ncbi:MAG: flagellar motor switch protein FliG [Thermodesulfobacteriota bacterium]|nr:flagellar motor switch protein FliG [Thermodesulfobacteriota bacterium]
MDMTKEEKAAALLLSLEEEVAANVMKNLGPDEIRRVGKYMTSLTEISDKDIGAVASEFCALAREKGKRIVSLQDNVVEGIIVKALGENEGKEFIESIKKESFSSNSLIIEKLRNTDPRILMDFTKMEHPQTIALILAHLRPEQTAEILETLPPDRQKDIIARITTLGSVPREFMKEMVKTLESEMIVEDAKEEQVGGVHMMAEILNRMSQSSEKAIFESLEEMDPDMATEIKSLMFTFDDIFRLDDTGMRILLEEISREDLAGAIKIVDDEMKEKVFKNMSTRAAEMLREDIEDMPPIRLSEVEKSQRMIIETAKRLESEGKIIIAGGDKEDAFV